MKKTISAIVGECFAFLRRPYLQYQKKQKAQQELLQKHLRIRYYRKQRLAQNQLKKHWWKLGICLFLNLPALGQSLKVGAKVPSKVYEELAAQKGKWLVIDFWATYCGSCLKALPEVAKLQEDYQDSFQIIPVSNQKQQQVAHYLERFATQNKTSLKKHVESTALDAYFPHKSLPYTVWINPKGLWVAATDPEYINQNVIHALLMGQQVNWVSKSSAEFNPSQHAVAAHTIADGGKVFNFIPGFSLNAGWVKDSIQNTKRYYVINSSILHLYALALSQPEALPLDPKRRILAVSDTTLLEYSGQGYHTAWSVRYAKGYERVFSLNTPDSICRRLMRHDLDSAFHFKSELIKVDTLAWVIHVQDSLNKPSPTSGMSLQGLVNLLNHEWALPVILLNSDPVDVKKRFELPSNFKNSTPQELQETLQRQGLVIQLKTIPITFFKLIRIPS